MPHKYGRITDAGGKPIAGAVVRINVTVISTNSNGEFQFTLVESGIYTIYYDAAGYGSQIQEGIAVTGTTITPTVIMSPSWSNAIGQPLVVKAGGASNSSNNKPFNTSMNLTKPDYVNLTLSGVAMNAEHVALSAGKKALTQPQTIPSSGKTVLFASGVAKTANYANAVYTGIRWSQGEATLADVNVALMTANLYFPGANTLGFFKDVGLLFYGQ